MTKMTATVMTAAEISAKAAAALRRPNISDSDALARLGTLRAVARHAPAGEFVPSAPYTGPHADAFRRDWLNYMEREA